MTVKAPSKITFFDPETESPFARQMNNRKVTVASEQTLTLANEGTEEVSLVGMVANQGNMVLESGKFSLANSVANAGSFQVSDTAQLGIGAYDSLTGYRLELTGNGDFQINGKLMLSVFSPADYDILDLSQYTGDFSFEEDVSLFLELPEDTSELAGKVVVLDWLKSDVAGVLAEGLGLQFSQPGWLGFIQSDGQVVFGDRSALPEPSSAVLFLMVAAGLGIWLKKRERK